jgi:uncharacterized protein (DUF697 family)
MNKKKLPRAILTPRDQGADLLQNAAGEPAAGASKVRGPPTARRGLEQAGNVIEMVPPSQAAAGPVGEGAASPSAPTLDPKRRRSGALAIVSRYAAGSAVGGMIPLPLVTFAGVTAVIVRMVRALSHHYGVPFQRDRARAIIVGLIGGAMPPGVAAVTTSALSYLLPPAAVLGVAASAISAAAFTRSLGRIFIEHFESGATLDDFSPKVPLQN